MKSRKQKFCGIMTMKKYDYDKIKEICFRHGLVCELHNYFCLPTDLNHFVVHYAYPDGNIKLCNKWVQIGERLISDLTEDVYEPYVDYEIFEKKLNNMMKQYKILLNKQKIKELEQDFT